MLATSWLDRLYGGIRRQAWSAIGSLARPPAEKEWIRFQFYHWVLDDQRVSFSRQLRFFRQYGDFLSLDEAIAAMESPSGLGGRYFCLTFDDGFKNCITNAVPVLVEENVPAAFFVATHYVGLDFEKDWERIAPFYDQSWNRLDGGFEFLDWDDLRRMAVNGFTIGSHTCSHARLARLSPADAELELARSKEELQEKLRLDCRHFCCPWGKQGRDYNPDVHPAMAQKLGYASFLTTDEGVIYAGGSPFAIPRIGYDDPSLSPSALRYATFMPLRRERIQSKPAPAPRTSSVAISLDESAPVQVGKFPYPFEAACTVASDTDGASIDRARAAHALICQNEIIRPDSPEWRTLEMDRNCPLYSKDLGGIQGIGLDVADSFFLISDSTSFGMHHYDAQNDSFPEYTQKGVNCAEVIRQWMKEGRIDSFHSFLHYTREQIEPLLKGFYQWCEREHIAKPKVWVNHSLPVTPTGLCPDALQPAWASRFLRLAARKVVGPMLGRKRFPLSYALARYQGDTPASPHYVNDLLAANGLRYVWLNMDDAHQNQITLPERQLNGRSTILEPVTMDDGVRYYRFRRCYGKPLGRSGGESYLRDSKAGFDCTRLISPSSLESLCRTGGTCILYTHWAHSNSFPISVDAIRRFELLRQWRDAGKIWVTPTARLLDWTRRRTFLEIECRQCHDALTVEINGVNDPIFGRETAGLADLDGLTLTLARNQRVKVILNGTALDGAQVRHRGNLCWLSNSADIEAGAKHKAQLDEPL